MVAPNGPIGYRPYYDGAWMALHFQTPGLQCRALWGSLGIPGLYLADRWRMALQSLFVCSTAFFESIVGLQDWFSCIIYCAPSRGGSVGLDPEILRLPGIAFCFVFSCDMSDGFFSLGDFHRRPSQPPPSCLYYLFKRLKGPSNRFYFLLKPSGHPWATEDATI